MYLIELMVMVASGYVSVVFWNSWNKAIKGAWPLQRYKQVRRLLGWMPVFTLALTLATLLFFSSYDVKRSVFYIIFYLLLGSAWQYIGIVLMTNFFDISWRDDILQMNNKASLCAFAGGFIGFNLIYNGANIGDGPGWWCVIVAAAPGVLVWVVLARVIHGVSGVSERISVERNTLAGVRFGAYLLASGLILMRACGGDWTSFVYTMIEFTDGWPVLVLAAIAAPVEAYYAHGAKQQPQRKESAVADGFFWVCIYLAVAVAAWLLLPAFRENPWYQ